MVLDFDIRLFVFKVKDGFVYVGMVCLVESIGVIVDFSGYVFFFDLVMINFIEVLFFLLNYDCGCGFVDINGINVGCLFESEWNLWILIFGIEFMEQVQMMLFFDFLILVVGFVEFVYF